MKKGNNRMSDREFAVILEKIYSDFRIFGEKLEAVSNRVDATFEEVGSQKEELFLVKVKVDSVSKELVIIKAYIKDIKKDVAEIKANLESHEKRPAHLEAVK